MTQIYYAEKQSRAKIEFWDLYLLLLVLHGKNFESEYWFLAWL